MTSQRTKDHKIRERSHSKAFKEGLGILAEELELAFQWNRPSIQIAIHNSKTGRVHAQRTLEQEIIKRNKQVMHINIESASPDAILVMSETPNSGDMVFFISGIENADRESGGRVYRALNMKRELLVERRICVVFWLNESEAANLPRFAPDFWSFRHRVVEFAPKHGTKKQFVPAGLFLWEEQIQWMDGDAQKNKLAYYEDFLVRLPKEDDAAVMRIETILKLVHYSWLLNDIRKFSSYLKDGNDLLEKYPVPKFRAWMLNAKAIGLFEEGNKQDAGLHITQALSTDPGNCTIMMNAGIAAYGLGKNRDAILIGKRAIKNDRSNFHLWRILGYLFLSMEKMEYAIEAMTEAREINPNNMGIHFSLAVCYYKNEQHAECANELSKAERISPPQNIIQLICVDILNNKTGEALAQLKSYLQKGDVSRHHILRDPNLHYLLNSQEFMESI